MLKGGMASREVEEELKGTLASDKNEILWERYGINYNDEEEIFKKGSVVFREVGVLVCWCSDWTILTCDLSMI